MAPTEPTGYDAFARSITDTGIITDPWLDGRPRFSPDPLVLSRAEHAALVKAGEELALVVDEAVRLVVDDEDTRKLFLRLTPAQQLMFDASAPLWHGIARADVFVTDAGLQITELNSDTPTGSPEAVVLGQLACTESDSPVDACAALPARFAQLCHLMHAKLAPDAPRTAAIVYPTELTEDLSLVRLYRAILEQSGWRVVLGSPYNLEATDDGVALFDDRVGLIVRHYKTDWWGERETAWLDDDVTDRAALAEPLAAILRASVDGRVAVVNPFGAIVSQSKRLLAVMWERVHRFSPRAQGIIERLVPYTARLEALHPEQLRADKNAWVLKSDYGAEGDEVVVGRMVDQPTWEQALALARPGRFVAQRAFTPLLDAQGRARNHGVFVIGGEACGVYTRLDAGLTDARSLSVATVVART